MFYIIDLGNHNRFLSEFIIDYSDEETKIRVTRDKFLAIKFYNLSFAKNIANATNGKVVKVICKGD